ncbi:MAG TPA: hypothetical protein VM074_00560 [Solimonas sp.]|nr:hypothetical protein [Solimonas sp.]
MKGSAMMFLGVIPLAVANSPAAATRLLHINAPPANSIVHPGETVAIDVGADQGPALKYVFVTTVAGTTTLTASPFHTTFVIPGNFTGPMQIGVSGKSVDGSYVGSASTTISVVSNENVLQLRADMDAELEYANGVGTTGNVRVTGIHASGVSRSITASSQGSTYQTGDPLVATVDAEGRVQATGAGSTVITVLNSGKTAGALVSVNGPDGQPTAPKDVTSMVTISGGSFRRDSETGLFVQEVQIRNTSRLPLPYPIHLVISGLPPGVALDNSAGATKVVTPLGSPTAWLTKSSGDQALFLSSGATVNTTLEFSNRDGRPITYSVRLFQGAGL